MNGSSGERRREAGMQFTGGSLCQDIESSYVARKWRAVLVFLQLWQMRPFVYLPKEKRTTFPRQRTQKKQNNNNNPACFPGHSGGAEQLIPSPSPAFPISLFAPLLRPPRSVRECWLGGGGSLAANPSPRSASVATEMELRSLVGEVVSSPCYSRSLWNTEVSFLRHPASKKVGHAD